MVSNEPISIVLIDLIHLSIDRLYRTKCFKIITNTNTNITNNINTNNINNTNNNSNNDNDNNEEHKTFAMKHRWSDDCKLMTKLQVNDYHELRDNVIPMIIALGPTLHNDTVLMYKLIRILRSILQDLNMDGGQNIPSSSSSSLASLSQHNTMEETLYNEVMTILDSAILPALSFLDCNCPMAEEIWSVVKHFPYHYR